MTYNFHSSCKHMHSSLKFVYNKENGGGGGGGGVGVDVFEVPYITAKIMFTHCSQFHNCTPYTDKRVFHSILSFMLQLSFLKIAFTFRFFCRDILAELRPSRRKFNNYSDTVCQTYFIDENALVWFPPPDLPI